MAIVVSNNNDIFVTYMRKDIIFNRNCININLGSRSSINKPQEAWWGSPIDAEYGWKEWCDSEEYGDYDFDNPIQWKLKPNTNILQIDIEEVLSSTTVDMYSEELKSNNELTKYIDYTDEFPILNFYRMIKDNISAVQLMDACIGHLFINKVELMFNSWDCESICVLDKNVIEFI